MNEGAQRAICTVIKRLIPTIKNWLNYWRAGWVELMTSEMVRPRASWILVIKKGGETAARREHITRSHQHWQALDSRTLNDHSTPLHNENPRLTENQLAGLHRMPALNCWLKLSDANSSKKVADSHINRALKLLSGTITHKLDNIYLNYYYIVKQSALAQGAKRDVEVFARKGLLKVGRRTQARHVSSSGEALSKTLGFKS